MTTRDLLLPCRYGVYELGTRRVEVRSFEIVENYKRGMDLFMPCTSMDGGRVRCMIGAKALIHIMIKEKRIRTAIIVMPKTLTSRT